MASLGGEKLGYILLTETLSQQLSYPVLYISLNDLRATAVRINVA